MNPQNMTSSGWHMEPLSRARMPEVILLLQDMSEFLPLTQDYDSIWSRYAAQKHVISIVALEHGNVIGFGTVCLESKIRGGRVGHIEDIVIHRNQRSRGIGSAIVSSLADVAKDEGCYKVTLHCHEPNVLFYEKIGFQLSGASMQRMLLGSS
jgi:glucosamine-phosphate N-acetyltransferase